jgi:hypothetical protein
VQQNQIVAIQSQWGSLLQNLSNLWVGLVCPKSGSPFSNVIVPPNKITQYVVVPVFGASASRTDEDAFTSLVGGANVVLITGLSHGTTDQFDGFGGEPLYTSSSNADVVSREVTGRIVHFFACSTASGLARMFTQSGCAAFIGYKAPIQIGDKSDAWLSSMLLCDATIEFSLVQGRSVAKAIQDAQAAYTSKGLDYIGALLTCYPSNSQATLPSTGSAVPPATIPDRAIAPWQLPPAATLTSRFVGEGP